MDELKTVKLFITNIALTNFGPISDKQSIDIEVKTNSNKKNTININNREKIKLNSVVGLIGPNASGKTTMMNWGELYKKMNNEFGNKKIIDSILLNINDSSKKAGIEIKYYDATSNNRYDHKFEFEAINKNNMKINTISEIVIKNGAETIWSKLNQDLMSMNGFFKYLTYSQNSNEELVDKELIYFYNGLRNILGSINVFNQPNLNSEIHTDLFSIGENLTNIFNQTKNLQSLEKFIFNVLTKIDRNIGYVKLGKRNIVDNTTGIKITRIGIEFIKSTKNEYIPPQYMSTGILTFLNHIIELKYLSYFPKTQIYVTVDELGRSWHSKLTKVYIEYFKHYSKNLTLIFSTHQSEVLNTLDIDEIYIIDKFHRIKGVSKYDDHNGKTLRKEVKFHKNYIDEINDIFDVTPDADNFYNIFESLGDNE